MKNLLLSSVAAVALFSGAVEPAFAAHYHKTTSAHRRAHRKTIKRVGVGAAGGAAIGALAGGGTGAALGAAAGAGAGAVYDHHKKKHGQ